MKRSISIKSKIRSQDSLARLLASLRSRGRKVVFTNGCFDILHPGHVLYLSRASELGDVLVIGLNSDRSVRAIKGRGRPVNRERDRALVLSALGSVDYITIFRDATPEKLIRKLKPDVLVKGADWKERDIVGADFVKSRGGSVQRIKFVNGHSTTSLLKRISS